MATLSGFWYPVFGSTQQNPQDYADWDSTHQQRYVGTGANRLLVTPAPSATLEDDVLDWIVGGSGRPTLGVHNRRHLGYRLLNLAHSDNGLSQSTIETYTEAILNSYDNDGYSDAIWGYVVNHEDTNPGSSSPYWEELGYVVNKIASEKPGKAIIAVGDLEGYMSQIDTFLGKLWASEDGLMIMERYVWRTGRSTQEAVEDEENAWRLAADKSKNLSTGNSNKWMGIIACHREIRDGNEYYRYPNNYELRYTALGPIAHGGQGTIFFLFEGGWDSATREYQAVYENSTQRTYVTNAITRMNQVAGYLTYFTYQAYAHSNNLPGSWSLDSISSGDPSNPLNILEVCYWTGPDGEEVYALCNRDPDNSKNVTANFDGTYSVYHDGTFQGSLSSYQFTLSEGNVAVLRLE